MSVSAVGMTYGQAIFELAQEKNILEQMEKDLLYVEELLNENKDLRAFINSPIIAKEEKIKLLQKIFQDGILTDALHFLFIMISRGRASGIIEAIQHYVNKSREARGILMAKAVLAREISSVEREKLLTKLQSITGKQIILQEVIVPTIMGGMIVSIDDKVIDVSIARRLKEMEKVLRSGRVSTTEIGVNESV